MLSFFGFLNILFLKYQHWVDYWFSKKEFDLNACKK
jgi:hypothetical protein